jgi:hypothetical protein
MLKCKTVSSLEKIFSDEELRASEYCGCSALRGEMVSFQVVLCAPERQWIEVGAKSSVGAVTVRGVELVPNTLASYNFDENYLRTTPGLYPDPLMPLKDDRWILRKRQWQSLWVSVPVPADCKPGRYEVEIQVRPIEPLGTASATLEPVTARFTVEVIDAALPPQKLIRSEWFHCDCVYSFYKVGCWSEEHWTLLEKYFANAAGHGINMLLTPLWTPPLDTAVNGERPTVQLLGITRSGDRYEFDFSRLKRWFELGRKCGFEYFDFAHPFTQWGACFTPKIIVNVDGREEKLFGWHVPADSPEYAAFLKQLIPQLMEVVRQAGLEGKIFFHISDEPHLDHLESYRYGAELLRPLIGDAPVIDALSNIDFYDKGVVGIPIPANNHIEPFYERGISQLFTYFCVSQWDKVPNRFFAMPSARNRIMGVLSYVYDLSGFLQWGYNFWYTQFSLKQDINPFQVTDAGGSFPGGDSFAVYPGPDGPVDSLRHEVFTEGLQDLRALRLLEERTGRQAVLELVHEGLYYKLTMERYPQDAAWLLNLRCRVNAALAENTAE